MTRWVATASASVERVVAWNCGAVSPLASASATAVSMSTASSQCTWSMPPRPPSTRSASYRRRSSSRKSNTMNAFAVETPSSTIAGSSAIGSSMRPEIARLTAKSIAESRAVAARHSRSPARSERSAAGDEPVPGLLNARNVVVPPNAAATESWKNRSGSASVATRVCVWTSTAPGRTRRPVASTTSAAPPSPIAERSASTAWIEPSRTATSARTDPPDVTTVPPRTRRGGT